MFCGMLDLCRIFLGIVVDLFRPHAASKAEILVLSTADYCAATGQTVVTLAASVGALPRTDDYIALPLKRPHN